MLRVFALAIVEVNDCVVLFKELRGWEVDEAKRNCNAANPDTVVPRAIQRLHVCCWRNGHELVEHPHVGRRQSGQGVNDLKPCGCWRDEACRPCGASTLQPLIRGEKEKLVPELP